MVMRTLRNFGLATLVAFGGAGLVNTAQAEHHHHSAYGHGHHGGYATYPNYSNYGYGNNLVYRPPIATYPGHACGNGYTSNYGGYNGINQPYMSGYGVGAFPQGGAYGGGAFPRGGSYGGGSYGGGGFSLYIGR